jgi:hypothetical protein
VGKMRWISILPTIGICKARIRSATSCRNKYARLALINRRLHR